MARVFWFRKDLRLQDNVALNSAISGSKNDGDGNVFAIYALDLATFAELTGIRQWSLYESLNSLNKTLANKLNVIPSVGEISGAIRAFAKSSKVRTVHATRAFDPEGVAEQNAVGLALQEAGIFLELSDSNYAIAPGSVLKNDGTPYRVYTPFFNAWINQGWPAPVDLETGASWVKGNVNSNFPKPTKDAPFNVVAGEAFALSTLERFKKRALNQYDSQRDRADMSGTSHLSHALAFGEIHPRTILHKLSDAKGPSVYRKEIAWREFYADVLWHNPHTTHDYYSPRFKHMRYDSPKDEKFAAWCAGKTGYPMVDAGMRQLLQDGWVHNRVRMIVASFLVKDLHIEWQHGAKWFEKNLSDFDPASNSHGWQWTAGCGTDASPYYRIFNPITQGYKFDPNGDYVRKYIPELRHIVDSSVHEPWLLIDGSVAGYPSPIINHADERNEALLRLEEIKEPKA